MFEGVEPKAATKPKAETAESEYYVQGSFRKSVVAHEVGHFAIDWSVAFHSQFELLSANDYMRQIAKKLEADHPGIEMSGRIKDIPVIKGTRLAVTQVLGRIFVLESIDAVAEFYRQTVSKDQIKAALLFAQDFLETACEPVQVNG